MDADPSPDHDRLTERLARIAAWGDRLQSMRKDLATHARERLDANAHAIRTASDAVARDHGGILTHRYLRTRMTEDQRLRALAGRPEDDGGGS
jgi:hypothetical protein